MSSMFMLDTNAISHAVRNPTGTVARRIDQHKDAIMTSCIVESELRFGIANKPGSAVAGRIGRFLDRMTVLPFESPAAIHYGQIRAELEAAGAPIEPMDTLIAAHARSRGACLVTDDTVHFRRVRGLVRKNWQAGA